MRAEIRRFIARNFYRSKYDYRAKWLEVTQAFQQATNKDAIMDCLLRPLNQDFPDHDHLDLVVSGGRSAVFSHPIDDC